MTNLQGIDLSNLQGPPEAYRDQPWYREAEFVLVQTIEPPAGFRGWDHTDAVTGRRGYTGEQLTAARDDGKKVGTYAWLWNTLADPGADILARLNIVPAGFPLDFRPWVDVEDTTPLDEVTRWWAIEQARAAADQWASDRGLPPSGGYSGDWYLSGYLGGWWPDGWLYWVADYASVAGLRLHPMSPVHQFTATPIDTDVMLESEVVSVTDQERQQYQDRIDGLVSALGLIAGDIVQPLRRKTAAAYVRAAVARIDTVADQFGVAHGG